MKTMHGLLLATALMFTAANAHAACTDFAENFGKVKRIYSQFSGGAGAGTFLQLKDGLTNALSGNNPYYVIPATGSTASREVYRSLYDILLKAAEAGWRVNVRTLNCGQFAQVAYIFVDY